MLTAIGTTTAGRAYDGTTAANVSAGTLQGLVGAERLDVAATGTFDSANAGARTATVQYVLSNGTNGGLASNYVLAPQSVAGIITRKALTAIGTEVAAKVYDGTTGATATAGTLSGMIGNETLSVTGVTGAFDTANAGQRTVTVGYALGNGANGGLASNYVVTPVQLAGTITPKALAAIGTAVATRAYDGTTSASVTTGTLDGLVGDEQLGVTATGMFDGANAGQHTATVDYVLSNGAHGGLASNYVLAPVSAEGRITPKVLNVVGTTVATRAYDGTANATASPGTLQGLVGGEQLAMSTTGTFDSANAGARTATVNYALADGANGGLAANYVLAPVTVSSRITPKTLTIAGTTAADKNYDGNATAAVTAGTLGGLVGNETLGLTATGIFDGATPGQHAASVRYTLANGANGGLASNYQLADDTTPAAQIRPMTAVENARAVAQQALSLSQLTANVQAPVSQVTVPVAVPNVVALPSAASTSFSLDNTLTLLSAPRAGERSEAVPLSAAQGMLGGNVGNGRDVRVPVGRNTLAEIVNGGVRLPSGVDQLLFVVADGNTGNGTGNAQNGKQSAEGGTGSLNGTVGAQKQD